MCVGYEGRAAQEAGCENVRRNRPVMESVKKKNNTLDRVVRLDVSVQIIRSLGPWKTLLELYCTPGPN